jgi:Bacterial Ig domain
LKNLPLLLAAFVLSIQSVVAQSVTQSWVQRYNPPDNRDDYGRKICRDAAGDVFVAGEVTSSNGPTDRYVVKYSGETGVRLWERRYDGPGGNADYSVAMVVDPAGNVIVTGPSIGANGTGYDYYTAKYNGANGAVIWEKRYHGTQFYNDFPRDMVIDLNGDVIVTGITEYFGGVDYYTVKYAGVNGAIVWERRIIGDVSRDVRLAVDSSGNVYVGGGFNLPGARELFTLKYTATGLAVWQQQTNLKADFAAAFQDIPGIACDPSGNPVILLRTSGTSANSEFYTVKYSSDTGKRLWERRLATSVDEWPNAMGVDKNGNVFVTGWARQGSPDFTNAFYTAKYGAANGALLWEKKYSRPSSDDQAIALAVDAAGNVIVSGFGNNSVARDFTTLKYAGADGALMWEQIYNGPDNREDAPWDVAADGAGGALVTGYSINASGNADILTIKYVPPPGPPTVVTTPASNITLTTATLNGRVSSNGSTTSLFFERSDRPGEPNWIAATPATAPFGASDFTYSGTLAGLQPHTSYSYRAVGRNSLGTIFGTVQSFTTSNTPPTATPATIHSPSKDFTFELSNIGDADGDTVTIVSVSGANFGTVTTNGSTIHYVGGPVFTGNDTFTYTVADGFGGTASSNVTLTNIAPRATNFADHSSIGPGGSWTVDIAPLVADADGDPLAIISVAEPAHGTVTFNGTSLTYTANTTSFSGNDSFSFRIADPAGASASGIVTLTNAVPLVINPRIHPDFGPGGEIQFHLLAQLANDPDGDPITFSSVSNPGSGSVLIDGPRITYTAGPAFTGTDSFTYTVTDRCGANAVGTISFFNAAPVANPDSLTFTAEGSPLAVTLNDTDADGDSLSIVRVEGAAFGTASIEGTSIVYTPNPEFEGVDHLTYTITDGRGASSSAVLSLKADHRIIRVLAMEGEPVSGIDGATWKKLGIPSIFQHGTRAGWTGTIRNQEGLRQVIVSGELGEPDIQLQSTDPVPDSKGHPIPGLQFTEFSDPVFAGDDFAFVAKLSGAAQGRDSDCGIWMRTNGVLRTVLREGHPAPGTRGTAKFDSFTSLAMPLPGTLFVVAKLRPYLNWAPRGGDNFGVWVMHNDGEVRMALRKGQVIDLDDGNHVVDSFLALYPVPGSPSHPRYDELTGMVDALVSFSDGKSAVVSIDSDATLHVLVSGALGAKNLSKFGTPSSPGNLNPPVVLAAFGERGSNSKRAVFDLGSDEPIAVIGDSAPGAPKATFRSFLDPVAGLGLDNVYVAAFTARLKGLPQTEDEAIYFSPIGDGESAPSLLAQKGAPAPEASGAVFKSFESLAILPNRGPIFTARLNGNQGPGSTDRGCWAPASDGSLKLVLRNGETVAERVLRSFSILDRVRLSPGQGRAFAANDETPTVIFRAKFEDNIDGILSVSLP